MKKTKIEKLTKVIIIFAMLAFQSAHAQIEFQDHSIDNTDCIYRVFPSDIDGDGDNDFFAICFADNNRNITWYENSDGLGNFIVKDNMSTGEEACTRLYPSDIDGDGDVDLLSASQGLGGMEKKLFWYENVDGQGNFSDRQIIDVSTVTAWSISASDMDGDGDLDAVASYPGDKIVWFENTDGQGTFGGENIIASSISLIFDIYVSDMDGDGDQDVLSNSQDNNEVAWYENINGAGSFGGKQIISTDIDTGTRVLAGDIDGDGDLDVLSSSFNDGKIAWYENSDGLGSFSDQNIIVLDNIGIQDIAVNDLDGDGDLDVLSTARIGSIFNAAWYENMDGLGNFGDQQVLTTDLSIPRSIHAVDIDGDLDMDVMFNTGSNNPNSATTYWYENLNPVKAQEYTLSKFTINPTLVKDYLIVESETEIISIEIYSVLGQLMLVEPYPTKVDVSTLTEGTYFCILKDENDGFGTKKVIKIIN